MPGLAWCNHAALLLQTNRELRAILPETVELHIKKRRGQVHEWCLTLYLTSQVLFRSGAILSLTSDQVLF